MTVTTACLGRDPNFERQVMLRVLHSSAGAGKTHALVKRYLTLCLTSEAPYSYRQVLALTFTNKAASEMRDRVLEYLADMREAHLGDLRIKDIFDDLTEHHDMSVPLIQERAGKVLAHMLHHYSDVSITTIDAFIRRAVIPFARDLGLDQDLCAHQGPAALDRLPQMLTADGTREWTWPNVLRTCHSSPLMPPHLQSATRLRKQLA